MLACRRWLVLALTLLVIPPFAAQDKTTEVKVPEGVAYRPDLTFLEVAGETLKLDVAMPKQGTGPFPGIVCIHGGGWMAGSRKGYTPVLMQLAERGYVVATISYRFAPKHKFPAQVEDVKTAVRWLRAKAKDFKLDPERIGALGDSAGGHLVAMLGVTSKTDNLEGSGYLDESSRVQAVVAFYGGFDALRAYEKSFDQKPEDQGKTVRYLLEQVIGGTPAEVRERYVAVSPATYVTKDDPPFLLVHGSADNLVLPEQSQVFQKRLQDAGVGAELILIPDAGHGFRGADLLAAHAATLSFFDKHLKPQFK